MATTKADSISAYRWLLAFTVLSLMLWLLSKTRFGYTTLYYLAVLVLLTTVLIHYQDIASALSPFSETQGGTTS